MDFLERMNRAVDYIEARLDGDIDGAELSRITCCNAYQFGRIFAYVVGTPLSEYIRRRRLSMAALDLQGGGQKVIDVALKWGYASPDSFARAFLETHGATPREARSPGVKLRLYPRIAFHISIRGDVDMEYRIEKMGVISCVGVVKNLGKFKLNEEADNWSEAEGDLWLFWDEFLDRGANLILRDKYKLYRPPFWQIGTKVTLPNGDTLVQVGAEAKAGEEYPELTRFEIPAHTWAVFTARGTLNQKVHPVTQTMTRVMSEWLPASGF
ncbi:MAG: AraC family transcriptional regulator, partial [Defluviitaleaceae bacterium]|nr:AraC family transcriptional regulator [Defluviitaleaceae bacterium]